MKPRKSLVVLAVLLTVVATVVWELRPSEPVYQGKRLSTWVRELTPEPSPTSFLVPKDWDRAQAQLATFTNVVRAIGTNALPTYVKWLQDVPRRSMYDKFDDWLWGVSHGRIHLPQRTERCWAAYMAFGILGPEAAPAIPDLAKVLNQEAAGRLAADCLAAIGAAALPALSNAVATARSPRVRYATLEALGDLGLASKPAAPLLFKIVLKNEPSPPPRFSLADLALRALAEGETNADALMPLLVERLADTNTAAGAAFGLARCGTAGIPVLLQAMTNEDVKIRSAAGAALDPRFQKYLGDERKGETGPRFRIFNSVFNLLTVNSISGPYSTNVECQLLVRIVQRYTNDSNPVIQTQATNVLNYFNVLGRTNTTPRLPDDKPQNVD
jgi:hypothetical protein